MLFDDAFWKVWYVLTWREDKFYKAERNEANTPWTYNNYIHIGDLLNAYGLQQSLVLKLYVQTRPTVRNKYPSFSVQY